MRMQMIRGDDVDNVTEKLKDARQIIESSIGFLESEDVQREWICNKLHAVDELLDDIEKIMGPKG